MERLRAISLILIMNRWEVKGGLPFIDHHRCRPSIGSFASVNILGALKLFNNSDTPTTPHPRSTMIPEMCSTKEISPGECKLFEQFLNHDLTSVLGFITHPSVSFFLFPSRLPLITDVLDGYGNSALSSQLVKNVRTQTIPQFSAKLREIFKNCGTVSSREFLIHETFILIFRFTQQSTDELY